MWYPVFLILIVMIYFIATLPKVKGFLGELTVRFFLQFLNNYRFEVFNNIYFPAYNGLYMQIDHMIVCQGCVIIIETKNYNGIVEGDWRTKQWTIRNGRNTHKAYNPMRQNSYHVRMLKDNNIVPPNIRIYPVVCLGVLAKPEITGSMPVVTPQKLISCIKGLAGSRTVRADLMHLSEKVKSMVISGKTVARDHISKLNSINSRKQKGLCPRCGGKLYYRNSLRGKIAICTNYPWCKYRNQQ